MTYASLLRLLEEEPLPCYLVDLDALDHNTDRVLDQLGSGLTLRPATKSIRVPGLLRYVEERAGDRAMGWMTFSAHETAFLAEQGLDDFLIAYPFVRPHQTRAIVDLVRNGTTVRPTVDHVDQVRALAKVARSEGVTLSLCLDVDLSWRPLGGLAHLGVRRSPIRSGQDALAVGQFIGDTEGVELSAVLGYEAQIAGMQDVNRGSRLLDPVRQLIKRGSQEPAKQTRGEVVAALREQGHDIQVVNGGGTGSVAFTSSDPSVTEVTAGSGFLCPHLFDGYEGLDLRPAGLFALEVVRTSDADFVTCQGGGYIASGEAGPSRLPIVHLPEHLHPVDLEGFGEVQTPMKIGSGPRPALGDPVICRSAKGGEALERFAEVLMVRDGEIVDRLPTYRGLGRTFF